MARNWRYLLEVIFILAFAFILQESRCETEGNNFGTCPRLGLKLALPNAFRKFYTVRSHSFKYNLGPCPFCWFPYYNFFFVHSKVINSFLNVCLLYNIMFLIFKCGIVSSNALRRIGYHKTGREHNMNDQFNGSFLLLSFNPQLFSTILLL